MVLFVWIGPLVVKFGPLRDRLMPDSIILERSGFPCSSAVAVGSRIIAKGFSVVSAGIAISSSGYRALDVPRTELYNSAPR
jgi:hypothetical protein